MTAEKGSGGVDLLMPADLRPVTAQKDPGGADPSMAADLSMASVYHLQYI